MWPCGLTDGATAMQPASTGDLQKERMNAPTLNDPALPHAAAAAADVTIFREFTYAVHASCPSRPMPAHDYAAIFGAHVNCRSGLML